MNKEAIQRRRASVVCLHDGHVLLVKLRDPSTNELRLFPPGGKIEAHEEAHTAAVRECLEETGYQVQVLPQSQVESHYEFNWNNQLYLCHTTYFAAKLLDIKLAAVDDADYNEGIVWVNLEDLDSVLAYDDNIKNAVKDTLLNIKNDNYSNHEKNRDTY